MPFAQRFLATYRNAGLAVPPTVIQELVHIATTDHKAQKYAQTALGNIRRWHLIPYDLKAVGHGITEVNAQKLMASGVLPDGENNDGFIVVETALVEIPNLVTSDIHLLGINPAKLVQKLNEFDLSPVAIFHPMNILR